MKFVAVRMFGATVHPRKSFGFAADSAQIQSNLLGTQESRTANEQNGSLENCADFPVDNFGRDS
jgi:hypothetical protein